MYLTSSFQKMKDIGDRAGCDKLFETSSAMVDGAATSVWNTQGQMVKLHIKHS